ncbi:Aste57867_14965 [Aphanomyces stellatus]|uniref:tRNA-dihydrouridine(16/17) synthase [NAD(P)(+)] n=1 Tax=Aphanomyces stellatus TaxID=120398 RepID=A0A485L2L1_9STRA|nr:hypothetical protein As57867_014909 [Aphanomyces stellatus]VFT91779.1 Aste57867_14965 [Aphanomyces stellatus]
MTLFSPWADQGHAVYVGSPMVDQSEFAFRELCRRYGTQLCYTPMLHAKVFLDDSTYRTQRLDRDLLEGPNVPVVVQFAGDDPRTLVDAAKLVQHRATAVDLNLGCPQPIARKGHYGSFLLRDTDTILAILRAWRQELSIPFTCKIRIIDEGSKHPDDRGLQATLRLVDQLEAAGAAAITVHGRNRLMTGKKTGAADWTAIAAIKRRVHVPVIANGNIETFADVGACAAATGAAGVMSAEGMLENPALFLGGGGGGVDPFRLAREYLALVRSFPSWNVHRVEKAHVARLLHRPMRYLARRPRLPSMPVDDGDMMLASCASTDDLDRAVDALDAACVEARQADSMASWMFEEGDSWYRRHRRYVVEQHAKDARKEVQQMWLAGGLRFTR